MEEEQTTKEKRVSGLKRGRVWAMFCLAVFIIVASWPLYWDFSTAESSGASFVTIITISFFLYRGYLVYRYYSEGHDE